MEIRLDGRNALITGASLGLGRAMALEFARSGARVAVVGRTPSTLEEARAAIEAETTASGETPVLTVAADVSRSDDIERLHAEVSEAFGRVDILVNNAGTSAARPFDQVSDVDWYADLDLKFMAAVRLIRLCLPSMKDAQWGRIINVLNIGAKAPSANSTPTSVTRAAGMALTKALAAELAPHGILVNAMNTGLLRTNQWHRLHGEQIPDLDFESFMDRIGDRIPLGRMGDPAEFAHLATFLASDHASFVTGTAINVDGGLSPVV